MSDDEKSREYVLPANEIKVLTAERMRQIEKSSIHVTVRGAENAYQQIDIRRLEQMYNLEPQYDAHVKAFRAKQALRVDLNY